MLFKVHCQALIILFRILYPQFSAQLNVKHFRYNQTSDFVINGNMASKSKNKNIFRTFFYWSLCYGIVDTWKQQRFTQNSFYTTGVLGYYGAAFSQPNVHKFVVATVLFSNGGRWLSLQYDGHNVNCGLRSLILSNFTNIFPLFFVIFCLFS